MAVILNNEHFKHGAPESAKNWSDQLNTGIGALVNHKMSQINAQKQASVFQQLGLDPAVAQLPQSQQDIILKQFLKTPQQGPGSQGSGGFGMPQGQQQGGLFNQIRPQRMGYSDSQQKEINNRNAPFYKEQEKNFAANQEKEIILNEMKNLWATGKVATGFKGRFGPEQIQNDETQLFDKNSNRLADLLLVGRGPLTAAKIKFAMSQKPNIGQNKGTQIKLIETLLKDTEKENVKQQIFEQILDENGGMQPPNLKNLVNQRFREYESYANQAEKQGAHQELMQENQQQPQQQEQAPEGETFAGGLVRNAVRGTARLGEAAVGAPGDILGAGLAVGNWATGGKIPTYSKVQEYLPLSIPTSNNIKETLSKMTNGYTDPQSGTEEVMDDILGTIGSLVGPGKLKALAGKGIAKSALSEGGKKIATKATNIALPFSGKMSLARGIGVAAAGSLGSTTAGILGGGPLAQGLTKAAFMTVAGTAGTRKALEDLQKTNYKVAEDAFKGRNINATSTLRGLDKLEQTLKTRTLPDKDILQEIIKEAKDSLSLARKNNGMMPINDLFDLKRGLNKYFGRTAQPLVAGAKHLPNEIRSSLHDVIDLVKKPLEQLPLVDAKGAKAFAIAEDISAGLGSARAATKGIKDNQDILKAFAKHPWMSVFQIFTGGKARHVKETYALLKDSKQAQEFYLKALKSAAEGSRQSFAHNVAQFDKVMYHESKKKK